MLSVIEPRAAEIIGQAEDHAGRHTQILLKTPEARVVLVGMTAGAEWPEHKAAGRVIVRVEYGRIAVSVGADRKEMRAGDLAAIDPSEPHTVRALEDAAFLLIVVGGAA